MPPRSNDISRAVEEFATRLQSARHFPNINRYVAMPQQEIYHLAQTRHRVAIGGNRGGKTYSTTADDVMTQLRIHPYRQHLYGDRPLRGRVVGVDFDRGIGQAVLPLWQQFVPPSRLVNGSWEDSYSKPEHMLTLADGGKVSFMSYEQDPDKFQAVWLDWIHFDEEPPQPIWRESMARLLDSGGSWALSMTPVQQMEWMQDEIIDPTLDAMEAGEETNVTIVRLRTKENVHLDAVAIAEMEKGLSEDEKKIRFEGEYLGGDLVFPEFTKKYPNVIDLSQIASYA